MIFYLGHTGEKKVTCSCFCRFSASIKTKCWSPTDNEKVKSKQVRCSACKSFKYRYESQMIGKKRTCAVCSLAAGYYDILDKLFA